MDRVVGAVQAVAGRGVPVVDRAALVRAARASVADLRRRILDGEDVHPDELQPEAVARAALFRLTDTLAGSLRPVVNLTGVVIHTNLGRAPLSRSVLEEVTERLASYTNLEYDLAARARGSRGDHVTALLLALVPAEAALLVNNNAAAVLLALAGMARGREVVVSRGELIEIGGGFRIPEVMEASGARLVEVGTTNRTRIEDYARAIGPDTAMLFKAHRSNFRMEGFVGEATFGEVAALAAARGVASMADLGSGLIAELPIPDAAAEPRPADLVKAGFDLVCFSGDKMLGGPQAGVIVGRTEAIERLRRHPLARALRVNSFTIAAMEATLRRYLSGRLYDVPVVSALAATDAAVRRRATSVVRRVRRLGWPGGLALRVVPVSSEVGGGSLPGTRLPSRGIEVLVEGATETEVDEALRAGSPAILGRVVEGRVVLDPRTLLPGQEDVVARALAGLPAAVEALRGSRAGGRNGR